MSTKKYKMDQERLATAVCNILVKAGIGLAVAAEIFKGRGGKIDLSSEPGG